MEILKTSSEVLQAMKELSALGWETSQIAFEEMSDGSVYWYDASGMLVMIMSGEMFERLLIEVGPD